MAPVVTSVSPAQGAPAGGTSVTITGSGFTGATLVKFGPKGTKFTIVSDTLITAKTPAGTGTVHVTVTAPTGTSTQNVLFTYTSPLPPAPSLSSVSPASGPTAGGNTVTLNGTNLTGATSVKFGKNAAAIVTNTSTQVTVIAPGGSPSSVAVTVTTAGGTSNALSYTYLAAPVPVLSSLSPTSGPTS
ncbi:IPT/TIG domain-containing protein, partial [Streptomyces sp. NPDC060232]|uniref:IPT/TIG domain-containing protein n=1 Tax=Streptomyces sp. NPDC060232 TaxID=3347079 RepID=UPI0036683496